MASFSRPTDVLATGYVARQPAGLAVVYLEPGKARDVLLTGEPAGRRLSVRQRDATSLSCPIAVTELTSVGSGRRFRLTPVSPGLSTLEARVDLSSTTVEDFVQVFALGPTGPHSGPSLGHDGPIPARFSTILRSAIGAAWKLNERQDFVEQFRRVVSALSGIEKSPAIYSETLNRMVISLVETTTNPLVKKGIEDEKDDIKVGAVSGAAPSYSIRKERNVWIRASALEKGLKQVTACIFHEAAHVAGAMGDPLAEFALEALHRTAGLPR